MNYKFLTILTLGVFVLITLISCDDDLSSVGGEVIDTIPGNGFTKEEIAVTAYSERIEKVQINGLPGTLLGTNTDSRFGTRTHSVLSQMELSAYPPSISETAILKNVTISIPYFSTATAVSASNETKVVTTTYKLDSIRNANGKIKLSIYYSDYFLSDFDEKNPSDSKIYYSNDKTIIPEMKKTFLGESDFFIPSAQEITVTTAKCIDVEASESKLTPRFQLVLDSPEVLSFFTDRILKKNGSSELSNTNNFQAFFRGMLLEADPTSEALLYLNLATQNATITLNYQQVKDASKTDDCEKFEDKELILRFSGNTLNLVDGEFSPSINTAIDSQDKNSGTDIIYLKGGDGAIGVIKLFSETPQLPEELKADNVIVNDALLRCYLSDGTTNAELEYLKSQRLYIYNYETGEPLADFTANPEIGSSNPSNSYSNHLGLLKQEGSDYYFDIKLTQHVRNLIYNNSDKENPLLGLCVTPNTELPLALSNGLAIINQNMIKAVDNGPDGATKIPAGAIIDPDGLTLVGNNTVSTKKLKLILTYTQPIN